MSCATFLTPAANTSNHPSLQSNRPKIPKKATEVLLIEQGERIKTWITQKIAYRAVYLFILIAFSHPALGSNCLENTTKLAQIDGTYSPLRLPNYEVTNLQASIEISTFDLSAVIDDVHYLKSGIGGRFNTHFRNLTNVLEAFPKLTEHEITAIYLFTSNDFEKINLSLRNMLPLSTETERSVLSAKIKLILSGIKKITPVETTSYRWIDLTSEQLQLYSQDAVVVNEAFASTSIDANFKRFSYKNTKLIIRGLTGRPIGSLSANASEAEVLFLPNVKFRVLDVRKEGGYNRIDLQEVL